MTSYPTDKAAARLSGKHGRMLFEESGLDRAVVCDRGYWTARKRLEVPGTFKPYQRRPGLVLPVHSPDGLTHSAQLRPDAPRKDRKGKPLKYETPAASRVILDVHPTMRSRVADNSEGEDLWITEGIKKADALTGRDLPTIGLIGVWNFQRDGDPLPCWEHVRLAGRRAYVVYDNDVMVKEGVQLALERLVGLLEQLGAAEVMVVYLPAGPLKGVDDFLAAGHTVAELKMLARKFEPADVASVRLSRDEKLRAAIEDVRTRWWSHDWSRMVGTGERPNSMRGHTTRDVMKVLVDAAARHGKVVGDAIEVRISTRTLALAAATSRPTTGKALHHLEAEGLIGIVEAEAADKARTYRLLGAPAGGRASLSHDGSNAPAEGKRLHTRVSDDHGGKGLRAPSEVPRLRWSSPGTKRRRGVVTGTLRVRDTIPGVPRATIKRLGKNRGAVVDALDTAGGVCMLAELCEVLHRSRPRDLRRRILPMLEESGILTVDGDVVELAEDWRARLEDARVVGGEIEREGLERERHRRQREAFRRRGENPPDRHHANVGADGHVEDLQREEDQEPQAPQAVPVSPLAAAIREYLEHAPGDACQPPGWIAATLWAYELHPGKASAVDAKAALEELGGERYLKALLERARRSRGAA